MINILIITNGTLPVPPVKGGAVENLVQTFIEINERTNDFQLFVFTVANHKAISLSKSYNNTKFIFIESETLFYKLGRAVRYVINKLAPNTFSNQFIHYVLKHKNIFSKANMVLIENNPRYAEYIAKISDVPIGLHLHNDYLNIDSRIGTRKILDNLNFVVGVSRYIKDRVSEISPAHCRVEFAYNGMKLDRFRNNNQLFNNEVLKSKYGIKQGELVFLFAGRIQETKGIKILIEAFLEILGDYNVKLLVVGSSGFGGSKKNKFIKLLEELSNDALDMIIFTGYIEYERIHEVYNLADVAIFPSLSPEAFLLSSIEALASGLPVIITDAGGLPETINERCGVVIERSTHLKDDLKREMIRLINDTKLREEMSMEAKKYAQKFDDNTYYENLSSIIKSLL